jgi:hypothetical protein
LDYRVGKKLHSGNTTGLVFEVVNLANISMFDNLLPPTGAQPPQLTKYGTIADRVFKGATAEWCPALWH